MKLHGPNRMGDRDSGSPDSLYAYDPVGLSSLHRTLLRGANVVSLEVLHSITRLSHSTTDLS